MDKRTGKAAPAKGDKLKVLTFARPLGQQRPLTLTGITQEYLEMYLTAAKELEAAQEAYGEIYSNLRHSLLAGAKVEPGTHEAHIIETLSTGRLIPQFRYKKLVVR